MKRINCVSQRNKGEKESSRWRLVLPCSVKLNSGGSSFPLGSLWLHSLSSLKNGWAHACSGDIRAFGVYSSSLETRAMASGGVRARNTCRRGRKCHISFRASVVCRKTPHFILLKIFTAFSIYSSMSRSKRLFLAFGSKQSGEKFYNIITKRLFTFDDVEPLVFKEKTSQTSNVRVST